MTFKRKLYAGNSRNTKNSRYRQGGELDLRAEFDEIVFGTRSAIPHGQPLLLRKARRDSAGLTIKCACVDALTREPDTEKQCSYCLGAGFYWDETKLVGYSTYVGADAGFAARVRTLSPGTIRVDYKVFYLRYDTIITYKDKIVELKLDAEGDPVVPYKRKAIYRPQTIVECRSDFGRLEFFTVYCREEDAIRVEV